MLRFYQHLVFFALGSLAIEFKLPLGINDFGNVVAQNCTFVDKTELIKEIMKDDAQVILITRPRLFGKSFNLSMLRYFFENRVSNPNISSIDIFDGLKISDNKQFCATHRSKYPLIHMSFKNIIESEYKAAETKVFAVIGEVYEQHSHLLTKNFLDSNETRTFEMIRKRMASVSDMKTSVFTLSKYLHQNSDQRVIVLIDEFEKLFQTAYFNKYFDEMKTLISGILMPCLKDNEHLLKAVMTGISVIGHDSVIDNLRDMKIYSVLKDERYAKFFGFTTEDVDALLEKFFLSEKKKLDELYYGYNFSGVPIYNPWSVLDFVHQSGSAGFSWVKTGGTDLIIKLVSAMGPDVKASFDWLLNNGTISKRVYNQISYPKLVTEEESFWTLLVHTGYLNAVPKEGASTYYSLRVPNKEIRDELIAVNKSVNEPRSKSYFKYNKTTSLAPPHIPQKSV